MDEETWEEEIIDVPERGSGEIMASRWSFDKGYSEQFKRSLRDYMENRLEKEDLVEVLFRYRV